MRLCIFECPCGDIFRIGSFKSIKRQEGNLRELCGHGGIVKQIIERLAAGITLQFVLQVVDRSERVGSDLGLDLHGRLHAASAGEKALLLAACSLHLSFAQGASSIQERRSFFHDGEKEIDDVVEILHSQSFDCLVPEPFEICR